MVDLEVPLLSICIPTYNRSEYLKKTIDSIIGLPEFNLHNVEIIISDNCSTDDTQKLCENYANIYANIKYFRNESNINDKNFPLALSRGNGRLLKLCNDTLIFKEHSLEQLLKLIKEYQTEKPVIFTNNKKRHPEIICTDSLEEFIYAVSFNMTWIGGLCVWKDDFEQHNLSDEGCEKKLWQVPFLLKYVNSKEHAVIYNEQLFFNQTVEKKNISYGLHKVFYTNFLGFCIEYIDKEISQECFDWLEKDLLFNFFTGWMIQYEFQNQRLDYSKSEDLIFCVTESYKDKPYYKRFYLYYKILYIKEFFRRLLVYFVKGKLHLKH